VNDFIEELARTELFRGVSHATIRQLADGHSVQTLEPGEVLLAPGSDNHHLYLLLSGVLVVRFGAVDSPDIREVAAGLSVGELSILDGNQPSAYVIAKTPCRVFALHHEPVLTLISDTCPVARNLLAIMARWVRGNTDHIVHARSRINELTDHAHIDTLTGLYNRRWLDQAHPELLIAGKTLCLLMLDVDHFKYYNDNHGHPAGDCALTTLGRVLHSTVRPRDFAVRYGGEEFLVLLPGTTRDEGLVIAERIRANAETQKITDSSGHPLPGITLSIGLALHRSNERYEELVNRADAELYRAKQVGRNRING
jgi:diguanylate cyclase (GGDEF)-like protein